MKALVKEKRGDGNVRLMNMEEPRIERDDEIKIAVKASGICGTDIKILHGRDALFRPPVIFGHEYTGEVIETGRDVTEFEIGDRVVFEPTVSVCEECRYCRQGKTNLCSNRLIAGFNTPGGFAEYSVRRKRFVHRLPENVGFLAGALCEPLAISTHAVLEHTPIAPGDVVVVIGPGAIGLMALQLAKTAGARTIIVGTAEDASRLSLASKIGAEHAVNIDFEKDKLGELVRDLTEGYGADAVVGCAGEPSSFILAIELLRKGGHLTQVGLFTKEVVFPADTMSYRELTLQGSFSQKYSAWKRALSLMGSGLVDTASLVSALPMSRWQEGFELAENKKAVKVVFEPFK